MKDVFVTQPDVFTDRMIVVRHARIDGEHVKCGALDGWSFTEDDPGSWLYCTACFPLKERLGTIAPVVTRALDNQLPAKDLKETRMKTFTIGGLLRNGTTLLKIGQHRDAYIVLCLTNGLAAHAFATWEMDEQGNTYMGHYTDSLNAALDDFSQRMRG